MDLRELFLQLETTLGSGIPIMRSLPLIAKNLESGRLRRSLEEMSRLMDQGLSFSQAMARVGKPFGSIHVSFIRFGEEAGCLDLVCGSLSRHAEREIELSRNLVNALIYPSFIVVVALLVGPIMQAIIGQETLAQALPTIVTRLGAFGLALGFLYGVYQVGAGGSLDLVLVHIPWIGGIFRKLALCRFTRALAIGQEAGVPIGQSLQTAIEVCDNSWLKRKLAGLPKHVTSGKGLASGLAAVGCLPPTLKELVSVGEESGRLPEMLNKSAEYFEQDALNSMQTVIKILPTLLFVLIAVYIGFMIIVGYGGLMAGKFGGP